MPFTSSLGTSGSTSVLHLAGDLTEADVWTLRRLIHAAVGQSPRRVVVDVHDLTSMSPAALRCLAFAQQHFPPTTSLVVEGASADLRAALDRSGLTEAVTVVAA